jgi:xanthine dehydrogenase accessory factor
MTLKIIVLGGGDLASGVALRLHNIGCRMIVTEMRQPYAVRRSVSFAQAVFENQVVIEGVVGRLYPDFQSIRWGDDIPILIDPEMKTVEVFQPDVIVDARMIKQTLVSPFYPRIYTVGLGPGFNAGVNCDAVIETQRGHFMGRVIFNGPAEPDTGIPERVANFQNERVLRSPSEGIFRTKSEIGDLVAEGEEIARVGQEIIRAPFSGMIRGLLHDGLEVKTGIKIGDIDPRKDPKLYQLVSDKALAVGGGVLEAILSQHAFRSKLTG